MRDTVKENEPMKKILWLACAVLVLASLQFGQTLGNDKLIAHAAGGVRWSQCAFGPDGVLWVVYEEDTDGSGHPIWVVSYDGTTVSTPFNVTGSSAIKGERPGIAVGTKGHVVATWGVLAESAVYMRVRDPLTKAWLPVEQVKAGFGADEPNAAVDGEGNIHVAWFNLNGAKTYARSKIGGAWGESTLLGSGKDCTVAVGSNGTVYAWWRSAIGSSYKNYYSTRTKTTAWTGGTLLSTSGGSSSHPQVTVGPDNVAVATWGDIDPILENGAEIRVQKIKPGSTREIVIPFYMQHYPRIAVDKDGVIHLACQIGGGDYGSGFRYTNNKGGTWKEPQTKGGSMNKIVGISADPSGNVAVCMSTFTTPGSDIWIYSLSLINPLPMLEAEFTFTPQTGYIPLTVNFTALQQTGANGQDVNYAWTFGDGGTGTGRTIAHTFTAAGTYSVQLLISDNVGRADTKTQSIEVKKTNPLPPTNLSSTISMSSFRKSPEISYNLFWAINPSNIPEHLASYAIYMKEGTGAYTQILTVTPATLSTVLKFTDLKKKRSFAISTLGLGGTESEKVYFQ
jgi:PKD repeat protein